MLGKTEDTQIVIRNRDSTIDNTMTNKKGSKGKTMVGKTLKIN